MGQILCLGITFFICFSLKLSKFASLVSELFIPEISYFGQGSQLYKHLHHNQFKILCPSKPSNIWSFEIKNLFESIFFQVDFVLYRFLTDWKLLLKLLERNVLNLKWCRMNLRTCLHVPDFFIRVKNLQYFVVKVQNILIRDWFNISLKIQNYYHQFSTDLSEIMGFVFLTKILCSLKEWRDQDLNLLSSYRFDNMP